MKFFEIHPAPRRKKRKNLDEEKRLRESFGTVGHGDVRNLGCAEGTVVRVGGGLGVAADASAPEVIR